MQKRGRSRAHSACRASAGQGQNIHAQITADHFCQMQKPFVQ